MKITITRKDWRKGLNYDDPCGCLLHKAIKRQTHKFPLVWPGEVAIGDRAYRYDAHAIEYRLIAAHRNPSLLPITISLK